jgi:dTDP-4-amino-4,6-dideoxygalactose transaminase
LPIKEGEIPFRVICFVKDAESTKKKLAQNSIEARRVFYPLHCQPYYLGTEADCPNSIWAYEHGLALPSSVNLTDEEIEEVCQYL